MGNENVLYMNAGILAFLGDAVYEVYIRNHVIQSGQVNADILHKKAVRFVKADAQAYALKEMLGELSEEEMTLVKRARNKKISTKAKNADPVTYKWATAFEALIGYLSLSGQNERMEQLIYRAMELIEKGSINHNGK